jgi:hypothetical protein
MYSLATDYQTLLEHHRRDPDDEGIWQQFQQTHRALIQAWCEMLLARGLRWEDYVTEADAPRDHPR